MSEQAEPKKLNKAMMLTIWTLAWPTMVEQTMQTLVQYIDTAMVGVLGTDATAAVGATSTVSWLIGGTVLAMGVGFLSYIAKAFGAKDYENAKRAVAQAMMVTVVVGVFLTILTTAISGFVPVWMQVDERVQSTASIYFFILYLPMLPRTASMIFGTVLRAAGDTRTPMKIGILMNCINILLNFLLIYPTRTMTILGFSFTMPGAGLGVIGAAVASAIAFTEGGIHITIRLWKHPLISPKGKSFRPDLEILGPCMKVAFPNMLQRFGTSLGYVTFASMINALGAVSTAAHTIANTVESAFYIPGFGMEAAASTLAGNAYGANERKTMNELAKTMTFIEICLMIGSGTALFLLAKPLMGIFSTSEEVIALGSRVLRMVAVSEPFFGVTIIAEGLLLGVGKTRTPFVYNILGMWCVRILGTFICTKFLSLGLISAWACMIAHNIFLFILYGFTLLRGTWNPLNESPKDKKVKNKKLKKGECQ